MPFEAMMETDWISALTRNNNSEPLTTMIQLKRVYDATSPQDGERILVERLWPRGVSKEMAAISLWLKEIAPSTDLRKWFGHDPEKWDEFCKLYWSELEKNETALAILKPHLARGPVTFVYAAHDEQHNSAVALKAFWETQR